MKMYIKVGGALKYILFFALRTDPIFLFAFASHISYHSLTPHSLLPPLQTVGGRRRLDTRMACLGWLRGSMEGSFVGGSLGGGDEYENQARCEREPRDVIGCSGTWAAGEWRAFFFFVGLNRHREREWQTAVHSPPPSPLSLHAHVGAFYFFLSLHSHYLIPSPSNQDTLLP